MMGWELTKQVRDHSKTKGEERCVLFALATRADDNGLAYPNLDTLEKEANVSRRQIQRYIAVRWVKSPEIYVGRGHGRGNSHHYTLLCGCSDQEVIRRLMINYNMTEAEAGAIWAEKKGDNQVEKVSSLSPFTSSSKGDICAEKVTSESVKGDILEIKGDTACHPNLNIESSILESSNLNRHFSSSPLLSESPAVKEEKEIENPLPSGENISILETEPLLTAFADLCGVNLATDKRKRAELMGYLPTLQTLDASLRPSDFAAFGEYYTHLPPSSHPRPLCPAPIFVVNGWKLFMKWYDLEMSKPESRTLPGTDDYLSMAKSMWAALDDFAVGDGFTYCGGWGRETHYVKQTDGAFSAVETEAQVS